MKKGENDYTLKAKSSRWSVAFFGYKLHTVGLISICAAFQPPMNDIAALSYLPNNKRNLDVGTAAIGWANCLDRHKDEASRVEL